MKSRKSKYLIVIISLIVALLHFVIGPDYKGPYKEIIRGYLIDILLPLSLYLLLQISLRKVTSTINARIIGAIAVFGFGTMVEILQYNEIDFLGSTFDPLDFVMYGLGIILGIFIDLTIINSLRKVKYSTHRLVILKLLTNKEY